jgi:hypothetical protein
MKIGIKCLTNAKNRKNRRKRRIRRIRRSRKIRRIRRSIKIIRLNSKTNPKRKRLISANLAQRRSIKLVTRASMRFRRLLSRKRSYARKVRWLILIKLFSPLRKKRKKLKKS